MGAAEGDEMEAGRPGGRPAVKSGRVSKRRVPAGRCASVSKTRVTAVKSATMSQSGMAAIGFVVVDHAAAVPIGSPVVPPPAKPGENPDPDAQAQRKGWTVNENSRNRNPPWLHHYGRPTTDLTKTIRFI